MGKKKNISYTRTSIILGNTEVNGNLSTQNSFLTLMRHAIFAPGLSALSQVLIFMNPPIPKFGLAYPCGSSGRLSVLFLTDIGLCISLSPFKRIGNG